MNRSIPPLSLVLSGGVALGSYQAGAFEALHDRPGQVGWIAGSSVGALNGAPTVRLMQRDWW
jgi:NTE family protein